jgi:hypothetical protein
MLGVKLPNKFLDSLRFSDFNKAPIPPPMAHSTVQLPKNTYNAHEFVSSLALNDRGQLAVLTSSFNLHFCKLLNLNNF